jgi:hypothetical protein
MSRARRQYRLDLTIECPSKDCGALVGKPCKGMEPQIVHFGRRLKRLLRLFKATPKQRRKIENELLRGMKI